MTRRMALATAGAVTIVLLAAAAAIAANLGVLRVVTDTGPGGLTATDLAPAVTTQQPADDPEAANGDDDRSGVQGHEPSDDPSSDLEPGDSSRPGDTRGEDDRYRGRDDDD
jgi:hypothetical protein